MPADWAEDGFVHPYVPGISTRGIEIGPEGGPENRVFTVRVPSCAAPEDLAMAVRLVAGLAKAAGATIGTEHAGHLDADAFSATFDAAWIARAVEADFARLREIAAAHAVTMQGPTRSVTIGPATLARVGAGSEPLLRVMRDVLYPNGLVDDDDGALYVSKGTRLARDGREIVVHAVGPGVDYFLPAGDVYALIGVPPVHVAASALPALAPDAVTPVDETSVRLRALEGDAWEELLDRARAVGHADVLDAVPPVAAARPAGTLLPLLRPPTWRHRDTVASRPLLAGAVALPRMPLVTIVSDTPVATASMPVAGWAGEETTSFAAAEASAVANLDGLELPYQEEVDGGRVVSLTAIGEYAAALLLSKRRLDEAHGKLGALLVAAVPIHGILRLQRGDDVARTGSLVAWAEHCFEDAGRRPNGQPGLTPLCFGIVEGRVQALVKVGAEEGDPGDGSLEIEAASASPRGESPKAGASPALLFAAAATFVVAVAMAYGLLR